MAGWVLSIAFLSNTSLITSGHYGTFRYHPFRGKREETSWRRERNWDPTFSSISASSRELLRKATRSLIIPKGGRTAAGSQMRAGAARHRCALDYTNAKSSPASCDLVTWKSVMELPPNAMVVLCFENVIPEGGLCEGGGIRVVG